MCAVNASCAALVQCWPGSRVPGQILHILCALLPAKVSPSGTKGAPSVTSLFTACESPALHSRSVAGWLWTGLGLDSTSPVYQTQLCWLYVQVCRILALDVGSVRDS